MMMTIQATTRPRGWCWSPMACCWLLSIATFTGVAAVAATIGTPNLLTKNQQLVVTAPEKVQYLLQHAIPVDRHGQVQPQRHARSLNNNNNQNQQQFQISGAYTLDFYKCASISSQPYDDDMLFDETLLPYTSKGQIAAQKSFVLFNVCETQYCDLLNDEDKDLYMIDVATYMMATTVNYQARKESYCTACASSANFCGWVEKQKQSGKSEDWSTYEEAQGGGADAADDAADENEDGIVEEEQDQMQQQAEGGEDNGARRKKKKNRQLVNYNNYEVVECESCKDLGCWADETDDDGIDDDAAAEWVQNLAACPQTAYDFLKDGSGNFPLYSGFMCNQDGSGVEIALFLDATCSIYDGVHSYYDLLAKDDTDDSTDLEYLTHATSMIMFPFLHEINCNGNLQYLSMQEYKNYAQNYQYEQQGNNQNNNNNQNNQQQASDYCKNLFDGQKDNGEAISLDDCNADGNDDKNNNNNNNGGDQQQVNEYGNSNANGSYMYKYILSYADSIDPVATCEVVRALNGKFEMIYRWGTSGQLFDYGTHEGKKNNSGGPFRKWLSQYDKSDITLVAAIIVGILLSIVALGCVLYSCCFNPRIDSSDSNPHKYILHRRQLNERRERLVNPSTGELA